MSETMYDGTLTIADPALVETLDMPDRFSGYVVRDVDAPVPDWDGIGYVYRVDDSHTRYDDVSIGGDHGDSGADVETVRAAWDQYRDWDLVARYLRAWHGAADVDILSRDSYTAVAVVTHAHVEAWGCESADGLAGQALETYRAWADCEVYGVIVVNLETLEESSLWGVYETDTASGRLDYCQSVADELVSEVS